MPTMSVSQTYDQVTVQLKVSGDGTTESQTGLAAIRQNLQCELEIRNGEKVKRILGDSVLLNDLVAVLERYLAAQLQGQPQGTFSGTVAIRPLDFVFHRLTVRQGDGIIQADLGMTQLYDLAEVLSELAADLPQLSTLKPKKPPAKTGQYAGIAALLVGGIGVAATVAVLATRSPDRKPDPIPSAQVTALKTPPTQPSQPVTAVPPPAAPSEGANLQKSTADMAQRAQSSPAGSAPVGLSPAGSKLESTLSAGWKTPASLTGDLTYLVTVDATGSGLAAVPQDATATEAKVNTPLAALPSVVPPTLPTGAETFTVTLQPQNRIRVKPLPQ